VAVQEEMRNILKETTKGAAPIVISTTRVKMSICVDFTVVNHPKERFAARRSSIVPDIIRESIVREVGEGEAIKSRSSRCRVLQAPDGALVCKKRMGADRCKEIAKISNLRLSGGSQTRPE